MNFVAPDFYRPERSATIILERAPRYSFGLKTNVEKPSITPGKKYVKYKKYSDYALIIKSCCRDIRVRLYFEVLLGDRLLIIEINFYLKIFITFDITIKISVS